MKKNLTQFLKANLTLACVTGLLLPMVHAEELKYPPINPALLYWQAAAQLPKLSGEQGNELKEIASGKRAVDPAKIESLGLDAAAGLLRKAAASSAPCDWGLVREYGPEMKTPHLSKILQIAQIAVVLGEARLAEGKTTEGLEWFLTAHRIARHSGAGGILISYLLQVANESIALQAAARHCLGWDETTRHNYAKKLNELPPLHGLQEEYRGELMFVDWLEHLAELSDSERAQKLRRAHIVDDKEQTELPRSVANLVNPENLRKELVVMRAIHRRMETAFGKPWKEAETELAAIEKDIQGSNSLLLKENTPSIIDVFYRGAGIATQQTMLNLALQRGSQINDAVAASAHDSFDGPLRLKKAEDGTLSLVASEQRPNGKTIELKFGK